MSHTSSTHRRASYAGPLVLLVLSGAGSWGCDDTRSDQVDADVSGHVVDQIQIDATQPAQENLRQLLNEIDTRVPMMEATYESARFVGAPSGGCEFDPRYLPRTPDAVEGWYRSCRFDEAASNGCEFDPRYLPRTPDAVEGWYRSCLRRE